MNFPEKIQDSKIQKNFTIFGCETKRQVSFITLLAIQVAVSGNKEKILNSLIETTLYKMGKKVSIISIFSIITLIYLHKRKILYYLLLIPIISYSQKSRVGKIAKLDSNIELISYDGNSNQVIKPVNKIIDNKKPTVIFFWLSTCGPCIRELNAFNSLKNINALNDNVNIMVLSDDRPKNYFFAEKISIDNNWKFEVYFDKDYKLRNTLLNKWYGVPQVMVLDNKNNIVLHKFGYKKGDEFIIYKKLLQLASIDILQPTSHKHKKNITFPIKQKSEKINLISKPHDYTKDEIKFIETDKTFEKQLEKFKGKILFVDTWFTSCGSCIKQFDHMKELDSFFLQNNVISLFICFGNSSDKEKWKKLVNKYQLKGYHLFLEKSKITGYKKELKVKYKKSLFHGAPRYLIVNKEGKIIDDFSPRPIEKQKIINIINNISKK